MPLGTEEDQVPARIPLSPGQSYFRPNNRVQRRDTRDFARFQNRLYQGFWGSLSFAVICCIIDSLTDSTVGLPSTIK